MSEDVMLQEAIEAIRQGQRGRARDLLTRLLRANQSNQEYWLWMSSVVDSLKEQIYCLQTALRLDPDNHTAKQGLVLLGALPPDGNIVPVPPVRRKWEVELQEVPKRRLWSHPVVRIVVYTALTALVIGLIVMGINGVRTIRKAAPVVAVIPTRTPGPSPTFTYTPTPFNFTPKAPTRTPKSTGPPPLWTLLEATYTPTPFYVNTPHPRNESFRIGLQAYVRGDWEAALEQFEQAIEVSPDAPDISYYIGEVYRMQGEYEQALEAYEQAINVDADFAPSYLGRARAQQVINPRTDVRPDLLLAIEKDPGFTEAYIELAAYQLAKGEVEAALENLDVAEQFSPESPLIYLYRALAHVQMGEPEVALEDASRANQMDLTMLLSYRVLAQAAAANDDYRQALKVINTYLDYEPKDPIAWLIQGEALYASGQYSQTLTALEKALDLNEDLADAYLYRGLAFIELQQGQPAVNEIYKALKLDPHSFRLNLQFGRALYVAERYDDALGTLNRTYEMVETDRDMAQVLYWRALSLEALDNSTMAVKDWQALIRLPKEAVPQEWLDLAALRLGLTPTPTPRRSPTAKPSPTKKATSSPTPTATPSPNPSAPSPSKTPTAKTPTLTPTSTNPTKTPTPGSNP